MTNINNIVASLVHDDMDTVMKMKKSQLIELVRELKDANYRELDNVTLNQVYEERFFQIIYDLRGE
jgi:hypothetical protein